MDRSVVVVMFVVLAGAFIGEVPADTFNLDHAYREARACYNETHFYCIFSSEKCCRKADQLCVEHQERCVTLPMLPPGQTSTQQLKACCDTRNGVTGPRNSSERYACSFLLSNDVLAEAICSAITPLIQTSAVSKSTRLPDTKETGGPTSHPQPARLAEGNECQGTESSSQSLTVIAIAVSVIAIVAIAALGLGLLYLRKRKLESKRNKGDLLKDRNQTPEVSPRGKGVVGDSSSQGGKPSPGREATKTADPVVAKGNQGVTAIPNPAVFKEEAEHFQDIQKSKGARRKTFTGASPNSAGLSGTAHSDRPSERPSEQGLHKHVSRAVAQRGDGEGARVVRFNVADSETVHVGLNNEDAVPLLDGQDNPTAGLRAEASSTSQGNNGDSQAHGEDPRDGAFTEESQIDPSTPTSDKDLTELNVNPRRGSTASSPRSSITEKYELQ